MGKKLEKSEKSSLAGVDFGEFVQGYGGIYKYKGAKKTPHGPVQGTGGAQRTCERSAYLRLRPSEMFRC